MLQLGYCARSPLEIRRAVGWGDENLLRPFLEKGDLKRAILIYRRHHKDSLIRSASLFPRTRRVLEYLKLKGYRLAVASNRPTRFSWILIRLLGLERYFDFVLCADKLRRGKPHPEILKIIMKRLSFLPRQTLYVGDMVIDAQAGRRAGIKTIIVTTGSSSRFEISRERPFKIIHKNTQLLRIL